MVWHLVETCVHSLLTGASGNCCASQFLYRLAPAAVFDGRVGFTGSKLSV